jgi:hypothetical protein
MNDIYKQFGDISKYFENLSKALIYKKLVKILQETKEEEPDNAITYDILIDALNDAIKYRTKCELEGKTEEYWTPTSKEMPPEGTYIITGKYGKNRYIDIADYNDGWNSYSDEYKAHPEMHEVIAWMKLPEVYKGDDKT